MRVELVTVDAPAAMSADLGGLLHWLLKQFSVICPLHWQWKHIRSSISLQLSLWSLLSLFGPLLPLPPLPPFIAQSRAFGASPFWIIIAASVSMSLGTMSLGMAFVIPFLSIISSKKTFHWSFLGIPIWSWNVSSCSHILAIVIAFVSVSVSAASVPVVDVAVGPG